MSPKGPPQVLVFIQPLSPDSALSLHCLSSLPCVTDTPPGNSESPAETLSHCVSQVHSEVQGGNSSACAQRVAFMFQTGSITCPELWSITYRDLK